MAFLLCQLVLLDVLSHFLDPNELAQLQQLIHRLIAHQERHLLENLSGDIGTIAAMIMPADQQSTR